jgi:predicted HicB family RNase H-like nuclease
MAKKWERMTKNQKLEILRAEVEKMVTAVGTLVRRLDQVEGRKSKSRKPKPRAQKVLHKRAAATASTASNTLNEPASELPTPAAEPPTATGTDASTSTTSPAQ